jgi:hypothetical protein
VNSVSTPTSASMRLAIKLRTPFDDVMAVLTIG